MYDGQIDVHGLGFSCDGQYLNVIDVTTNAVHVIDTAPARRFFSADGSQLWVAERGQDTVASSTGETIGSWTVSCGRTAH
jgi:hypothetical protein